MKKRKTDGIPVVFRVLKSGEVIALMPGLKESLGKCASVKVVTKPRVEYGVDSYKSVIRHSRPAISSQCVYLLDHLREMGMVMSVRKKWTKKDDQS